ncbi:MAG TPA: polysaccharide deacetylase family protein [Thermomicrobiaceae bacterium]|nr:polysaccharide deacetylase family protein [Thermomicrobiaceae bacterium]
MSPGPRTYVTTSWDDGHPLDLRVADLLARYGLQGTFYVPMQSERPTMTPAQVREIASRFEVGAHTLHHRDLTALDDASAAEEIAGSRVWVEGVVGGPCTSFCFPKGHFRRRHLALVRRAGFAVARTTELLSLDRPRPSDGLLVMPTTVQARPHSPAVYARNCAKRGAVRGFWRYVVHGHTSDWVALTRALHGLALAEGGVFHLWGHSWEIDDEGQWERLDEALRYLAHFSAEAPCVTNGALTGSPVAETATA